MNFIIMYQKKMCDFTYNNNFDITDASVDVIVRILINALNKVCHIIIVISSYDNDTHKPWFSSENKSLLKKIAKQVSQETSVLWSLV